MIRLLNYCKTLFAGGIDKYKFTSNVLFLNLIFSFITFLFIVLAILLAYAPFFIPFVLSIFKMSWSEAVDSISILMMFYFIIGLIYYGIFFSFIIKRIRDIFINDDVIFWCSVIIVFTFFILSFPIPFLSLVLLIVVLILMLIGNSQKQKNFYILNFVLNIILSLVIWLAFAFSFATSISRIINEHETEQQQEQQYAAHGRWIGDLYIAKMPVKKNKIVGKMISNGQKVCTEVGMRMPTLEDFEYISENLYSGDVDSLSDTEFRKFSSHEIQENLQWLSNWDGDYLTSSVDSDGKNIIYNMKIDNKKTCRFITLSRNAYEWSAVDTCIRHSVTEKPFSYSVSKRTKTNPEKLFRTICVND